MAKVSKNARTDRKVQEGSKDYVKVIYAFRKKGSVEGTDSIGFRDAIVHKDKVAAFLETKTSNL